MGKIVKNCTWLTHFFEIRKQALSHLLQFLSHKRVLPTVQAFAFKSRDLLPAVASAAYLIVWFVVFLVSWILNTDFHVIHLDWEPSKALLKHSSWY